MKFNFQILLIFLIFLLSIKSVSAITFWNVINILENPKTWEIKYIDKNLPSSETNLFQNELDNYAFHNLVWIYVFENWKGKCFYEDTRKIEKVWDCIDLDNDKIKRITSNDLTFKDKFKLYINIVYEFCIYLIIWIPFNFFVFFWLTYALFWRKISLLEHLIITTLLEAILDIILISLNFSLMQLDSILFWSFIYMLLVIAPKFILALYWIYRFYKYKKEIVQ